MVALWSMLPQSGMPTRAIYLLLSLGSRTGPEVVERAGRSSTTANTSGRLAPAISAMPSVYPRMLCKLGHAGAEAGVYNKQSQSGRQILKHQAA